MEKPYFETVNVLKLSVFPVSECVWLYIYF